MMSGRSALSSRRMLTGLVVAAVAGSLVQTALLLGSILAQQAVAALAFGHRWQLADLAVLGALHGAFGLPLALVLCATVGLPLWKCAERRAIRSSGAAFRLGALAGTIIGLLLAAFALANGLAVRLDENFTYNTYTYGYPLARDGLPTALGWLYELLALLRFGLAGAPSSRRVSAMTLVSSPL